MQLTHHSSRNSYVINPSTQTISRIKARMARTHKWAARVTRQNGLILVAGSGVAFLMGLGLLFGASDVSGCVFACLGGCIWLIGGLLMIWWCNRTDHLDE